MSLRSLTPRSQSQLNQENNSEKSDNSKTISKNLSMIQKCQAHPDEELLFVCYNCHMKCLCIECISSTPDCQHRHIGHEIKNIKKAKPDIMIFLNQHLTKLKRKIETIGQMNERINLKKVEILDINENLQKSISTQFSEIKQILHEKENEILNNVDELWSKRLSSLNELMNKIDQKQKVFIDSQKVIEETINQLSDQQLCQYYFKKQKDLEELARDTFEGLQVERALEDLLAFKQEFSTESLKRIIFSFTTLQEEIMSLKGLETIHTQYLDTENSFFQNSPNFSRIQSQQSSNKKTIKQRQFSCNNEQILSDIKSISESQIMNQSVQINSQQMPVSFLQKANETVVSKQTNGSNIKNASNFMFTSSFDQKVESSPVKKKVSLLHTQGKSRLSNQLQQQGGIFEQRNQSNELQSLFTPTLPFMNQKNSSNEQLEQDIPQIKLSYVNQNISNNPSSMLSSQVHSYTQQNAVQSPLQPLSRTKSITIYSQNSFQNSMQNSQQSSSKNYMQNSVQQRNSFIQSLNMKSKKQDQIFPIQEKAEKDIFRKKNKNTFLG